MKTLMTLCLLLLPVNCSLTQASDTSSSQAEVAFTTTVDQKHEAKLTEVRKRIAQVSVGMKRSEVELLFREKDGGFEGPSTRYYEDPEVMIEIPFDQTGGDWNKNNRVTGSPKIYRSKRHVD